MRYRWNSSSHPISDLRDWSNTQRLEIRPDFQRKEVWSKAANCMLMDTILRNIPMPKMFFQAVVRTTDTYRIVIDGQQRIKAILNFLQDKYSLETPYQGEYANRSFSQLPEEVQRDFLSYKIDINEVLDASDEIAREIYSRVNKYTVALSRQELRRADYPGHFLALAETLALTPFFDESRIFTPANSKRMGDVEFISELLALLLYGSQNKREDLDEYYRVHMEWDIAERDAIRDRFLGVIEDIQAIWSVDVQGAKEFSKTRFRQKSDFYSLFAAIDECRREFGRLGDRPLQPLRQDLEILDDNTAPESEIGVLREYAIKCVSQANTAGSRTWRTEFLKMVLIGTYSGRPPSIDGVRTFHELLWDLYTPLMCGPAVTVCPACTHEMSNYSSDEVLLTWRKSSQVFQISNSVFVHNACAAAADATHFVWPDAYRCRDTL